MGTFFDNFTVVFLIQGSASFKLNLNIYLVILLFFCAAVIGDNVGYEFGKKMGPRLFKKPDSLLFRQSNVQKAQDFYNQHGGKTIIIARFIPIVRTFVPLVAGIAKMDHKTFFLFNMVGGAIWTVTITCLGYFLGALLTKMGIDIDSVLLPLIAIILIASVSPVIYQLLKTKEKRQIVFTAVKTHAKRLVKRSK